MVAACAMPPGVYFAINSPPAIVGATPEAATATISNWGYPVDAATMARLAHAVGEQTLFNRTGGAPSLAVGMAQIFSSTIGGERLMSIWYHFAIMFEALFILTVLDAGTRVGRFMVQELGSRVWKPFGRTAWMPGVLISSALIVGGWGYFLYQGVIDPLGGINSLWPLFGISNQLLAAVALVVATTILLKMGKLRWIWVTLAPMAWLVIITMTASWQKIFHASPRIGFLVGGKRHGRRKSLLEKFPLAKIAETQRLIFNQRLDAAVTAVLAVMILVLLGEALVQWAKILSDRHKVVLQRDTIRCHAMGARSGGRLMREQLLATLMRVENGFNRFWRGLREWCGDAAYERYRACAREKFMRLRIAEQGRVLSGRAAETLFAGEPLLLAVPSAVILAFALTAGIDF